MSQPVLQRPSRPAACTRRERGCQGRCSAPLRRLLATALLAIAGAPATAQELDLLEEVSIDQRLGALVPPEAPFVDSDGREVRIGDLAGRQPIVLALVYYECPMLCHLVVQGLQRALRPLSLEVGRDFDVLLVSIDDGEGPEIARAARGRLARDYGRGGSEVGWHAWTGERPAIDALAGAVGFRYRFVPETGEYAHASGILVLTPGGVVSRYFYGVEYSSRDLRLALVEASEGKVGTLADKVLLWCFAYDPTAGRYGFAILGTIRVLGVLTLVLIGGFVTRHLRRERRAALAAEAAGSPQPGR